MEQPNEISPKDFVGILNEIHEANPENCKLPGMKPFQLSLEVFQELAETHSGLFKDGVISAISGVLPKYSEHHGGEAIELYYQEAWVRDKGWHITSIPLSVSAGGMAAILFAVDHVSSQAAGFAGTMASIVIVLAVTSWKNNTSRDRAFRNASRSGM